MVILAKIIQLSLFALGLTLIAHVFLAYESEEKGLIKKLEAAWVRLDDADRNVGSKLQIFLVRVSTEVERLLDRLYGRQLISLRFLSTAISLIGAVGLGTTLLVLFGLALSPLLAVGVGLAGMLPIGFMALSRRKRLRIAGLIASLAVFAFNATYDPSSLFDDKKFYEIEFIRMISGLLVELLSIVIIRYCLRRVITAASLKKVCAWLALSFSTSFLLISFAAQIAYKIHPELARTPMEVYLIWGSLFNLISIFSSCLFVFFSVAAILLRIVFSFTPRILYSTLKMKLFDSRKSILALGVALISVNYPSALALMERFTKPFG